MNRETKAFLQNDLDKIRIIKNLAAFPLLIFCICFVVFFFLKLIDMQDRFLPVYQIAFYLGIFGFIMSFVRSDVKCPCCGEYFNRREGTTKQFGVRFYTWAFKVFARKYMNCGIKLNGKSLDEYQVTYNEGMQRTASPLRGLSAVDAGRYALWKY